MEVLVIFIFSAFMVKCLADSDSILHSSEETNEIMNDTRYLLWQTREGSFELEDLDDNGVTSPTRDDIEDKVTFYFFTPKNRKKGIKIKHLPDIVNLTGFDVERETLVIIHGWKNNEESAVNNLIKTAALKERNINVIVVDWSPLARGRYITARLAILAIGNYVGDFILKLDDDLNHKLDKVTIVGHSLGAHISGNAGARTKGLINTIVGLDPSGPLFKETNINNRLDPTDANYVQIIHTSDDTLGLNIKMGHADYYPNGGTSQPGCGIDLAGSCAHSRAYQYYAESLINDNFKSTLCKNWFRYRRNKCDNNTISNLGSFPVRKSPTGNYYLTTNSNSPFAQG